MREAIRHVDDRVDSAFDAVRGNRLADRIFYGASALGDFGLIWVGLALLRALRGRPNDQRAALRAIIATGLESVLINVGVKSLFGRRRPESEIVHPHRFRQPVTSSFPSGHATAGFCAATLLSEQDELGPLYFAVAAVVATSRVHTKIHHASDVLGGALIGTALGLIGRRLAPLPPRRPSSGNDKS